jgi:heat shock protein HslJ
MRTFLLAGLIMAASLLVGACASEEGGDITGTTWQLVSLETQSPQFSAIVPGGPSEKYTITFNTDGTFNAQADCNQVGGTYTIQGEGILTIKLGPATLAECGADSLGDEYTQALSQAGSFTIAENQLNITLLDDGVLTFQAAA